MGVVSEDKLLGLLELAMSSNATETVRRLREVIDSGVDPLILTSQLVTLVVDIIAGTQNDSFFGGKTCKSISVFLVFSSISSLTIQMHILFSLYFISLRCKS